MKFQCNNHGPLEKNYVGGYSLGHHSSVPANERNLEGITFVIHAFDGKELTARDVEVYKESKESYLEKFVDLYVGIADAVKEMSEW